MGSVVSVSVSCRQAHTRLADRAACWQACTRLAHTARHAVRMIASSAACLVAHTARLSTGVQLHVGGRVRVMDIPDDDPVAVLVRRLATGPIRAGIHSIHGASATDLTALAAFMSTYGFETLPATRAFDYLLEHHLAPIEPGYRHPLGAHQDDHGGVSHLVNGAAFYLKNTAERGGLVLWDDGERGERGERAHVINTRPPAGHVRVVLMCGDVWHAPEESIGVGVRELVVFQCARE
jgi:hypothetical protein